MRTIQRVMFAAVAAAAAVGARAQDVGAAVDMTGMGIYGMEEAVMEAARGGAKRTTKAPNPLLFKPSLARRKQNYAAIVADVRTRDPKAAAELQATFAKMDLIAAVQKVTKPMGFRPDSAADAYATWMLVAYSAAYGKDIPSDRATQAAVRAQVRRAFASAKGASGLSDTTKQRLADSCLVHAALLDGFLDQAKADPSKMGPLRDAARKAGQASGINFDRLTLTTKGFVAR